MYRRSVLKKYISNVLFLNMRSKKGGKITEQFLVGIAAGVAMLFSTFVSIFYQNKYGNFTTSLILVLVISYIFKDRIKESLKFYFKNIISEFFPDYDTKILTDNKKTIGRCKETFTFVKEKRISPEIITLRQRERLTDIENDFTGEKVIFYKKQIIINNKKTLKSFPDYDVIGINDIIRFNISRFLLKMDNPEKTIYLIKDNNYKKIKGQRVYHVNMILKYKMPSKIILKKYRLILNRNGLKRIEKVDFIEQTLKY